MSANDKQIGGDHYHSAYQHWDFQKDVEFNYLEAQVAKYVTRYTRKNGAQDLEKALHFLEKLQEEKEKQWACCVEYAQAQDFGSFQLDVMIQLHNKTYRLATDSVRKMLNEMEAQPKGYVHQD